MYTHGETHLGHEGGGADDRPILLTDIDRVLEDSAQVARADAPIRSWRDELTVALESLAYARAVLAADVGILRHSLATAPCDNETLVKELPAVVSSHPWGKGWASPDDPDEGARVDWAVFARADQLMSAHDAMASTDLSSTEDVLRALGELEGQLAGLARRQEAVERRLQEIRTAIVRQYEGTSGPGRDWLG
jgi:hypothetical protein